MTEKYRILRTMAVIYKILAWVSLAAGVAFGVFALVASSLISQQLETAGAAGGGFLAFIAIIVYSLISFGSLYALSEGIYLLFDINEETKMTRERMGEIKKAA